MRATISVPISATETAEMLRDSALAASGLLQQRLGRLGELRCHGSVPGLGRSGVHRVERTAESAGRHEHDGQHVALEQVVVDARAVGFLGGAVRHVLHVGPLHVVIAWDVKTKMPRAMKPKWDIDE